MGRDSAILVLNEITSLTLYHICKVLYQRTYPTSYNVSVVTFLYFIPWSPLQKFWQTPNVARFLEFPVENSVPAEFWMQRSFQKFSFVSQDVGQMEQRAQAPGGIIRRQAPGRLNPLTTPNLQHRASRLSPPNRASRLSLPNCASRFSLSILIYLYPMMAEGASSLDD